MRKVFILFIIFIGVVLPQNKFVTLKFSNLIEATNQTGYVDLSDWSRIDSIDLSLVGSGLLEVDSINVYPGFQTQSGGFYFGTAYTFLCDDSTTALQKFWTDNIGSEANNLSPTVLTSAVMRGAINTLKVVVAPADTSATGNRLYCNFEIYGTPKGGTK